MSARAVKWSNLRHHWDIYLFIVPTLILIALFQYYPAASGIIHSFFRWNGADIAEPVGFENYIDLLTSREFWDSFNVVLILGAFNVVKMIPPLLVAVCIHRCSSVRFQFFYRTLFVVPMVIPPLVVALIWRSFFFEATAGYLNQALDATGLMHALGFLDRTFGWGGVFAAGNSPAWLGDPRLILTACIVWGFPWVGSFAVLTHLAKLQGISKDIYEAGDIDGISWWSKFWKIELPLLMSSVYLLLVFVIIDTIKDAGTIYALAGIEGGPGGKVTVPALFMLRKAFLEQQMGYACGVGLVLTLVVLGLQKVSTLVMNWPNLWSWQKRAVRLGAFAFAAFLFWMDAFEWLAWIIVAAAIPYGALGHLIPERKADDGPTLAPADLKRIEDERDRRFHSPLHRFAREFRDGFLRVAKHGMIWGVAAFAFLPLYLMLVVSLKNNQQFYEAPATLTAPYHWENWRIAWEIVLPTVANSIFISTLATVLTLLFAICAAYFFARLKMPLSGFFWNAILILMMLPAIANLVPLFTLLRDLSMLNTLSALILVGAASGQVFAIFVLRNFVADVPFDLFEAAEIDGASHLRQMWNIVVPLSGPILGTVGVMQFLHAWNEFILPLIVMRDHARLPVMVQLLRMAGEYIKLWGPLMAGYALASIPIILLFVFSMKLFIRGLTEGATKG